MIIWKVDIHLGCVVLTLNNSYFPVTHYLYVIYFYIFLFLINLDQRVIFICHNHKHGSPTPRLYNNLLHIVYNIANTQAGSNIFRAWNTDVWKPNEMFNKLRYVLPKYKNMHLSKNIYKLVSLHSILLPCMSTKLYIKKLEKIRHNVIKFLDKFLHMKVKI